MTRCRQPAKDEDTEVFVVVNLSRRGDANVPILCEGCGETFFTNPDNRSLAIERKMRIRCLACAHRLAAGAEKSFPFSAESIKGKLSSSACSSARLRALRSGRRGRWFESSHADQLSVLRCAMKLAVAYDQWCEGRVRALLLFLEEWLSISQKYAERGMIALYVTLVANPWSSSTVSLPPRAFLACMLGYFMWTIHRRPEAVREISRWIPRYKAAYRIILQICLGFFAIVAVVPPPPSASNIAVAQIVYVVFIYMTDITSNGERGRRRKLSWAKIKELFGTVWIPKPLLTPQ